MRWLTLSLLVLTAWVGLPRLEAAETNLVEILRRVQAEMDARERGRTSTVTAPFQPVPVPTDEDRESDPKQLLNPRDVLELKVEGEPDMSLSRAEVRADGTLLHPIAGAIAVGGKTLAQATVIIRDLLARDYLVDPEVKLRLVEPARCSFTILNQVMKPGTYTWRCGETMTILRAIALAGGPTPRAALSRVTVKRVVDGESREIPTDLDRLNRHREARPLELQAGDVVELPVR